jgi:hypothetical protein
MKPEYTKTAYISVTLHLNEELTEEEIEQILEECDYNFDHQWIENTTINGIIDNE